jgi:hypothetical protein
MIVAQKDLAGKWPPPAGGAAPLDFRGDPLQNAPMNKQRTASKTSPFVPALLALIMAAASGLAAAPASDDVLAKLNLDPAAAKQGVLDMLVGGALYDYQTFAAFKPLAGVARETAVRAWLGWMKGYTAGGEFKAAYDRAREQEKPEAPAPRPSADDQMKKMKAEMEKNIAEMRQNMAAMDAEMRKQMEAVVKEMRAQVERLEKDPQQKEMMRQGAALAVVEDQKRHEQELQEWGQRFPSDPRELIQRRLNEFLAASAGIDYAAKLKPRGDKMVFVNEAYEQKPPEWKLYFRAGREATEAARALAKAWLAELDKT